MTRRARGAIRRAIERIEGRPLGQRLALAWGAAVLPRAAAVAWLPLAGDYRIFADPDADTGSFLYPLYRGLAEALWTLGGQSLAVHVALHVALHAALGPLVYLVCRRAGLAPATAWLSVAGVALLPYYVAASARQPQVGVVVAFTAGLVWLYLRWQGSGFATRWGLGFAAASGAALFLRPNLVATSAAFYALAACVGGDRERTRVVGSAAALALLVAVVVGATWLHSGRWSPLPPVAGYNLYLGHNPLAGHYLGRHDILSLEDAIRDHGLPSEVAAIGDAHARDAALWQLAVEYARSHPAETARNTLRKLWRYWDPRLEDADRNPLAWNLAYSAPYVGYGSLAIVGAVVLARRRQGHALAVLGTLLASYCVPHLVFFPTIRMRMTTEFALIVLAAVAVAAWLERGPSRSAKAAGI